MQPKGPRTCVQHHARYRSPISNFIGNDVLEPGAGRRRCLIVAVVLSGRVAILPGLILMAHVQKFIRIQLVRVCASCVRLLLLAIFPTGFLCRTLRGPSLLQLCEALQVTESSNIIAIPTDRGAGQALSHALKLIIHIILHINKARHQ